MQRPSEWGIGTRKADSGFWRHDVASRPWVPPLDHRGAGDGTAYASNRSVSPSSTERDCASEVRARGPARCRPVQAVESIRLAPSHGASSAEAHWQSGPRSRGVAAFADKPRAKAHRRSDRCCDGISRC
jgi:hypothetical protein